MGATTPTTPQFDADVNERLAAIVDSSFDAIISKDLGSIIRTWNAGAQRLFGYTADEAIGQSIIMLIPEHLRNEETDIIARIRAGERVASYETIRRRKDGTGVFVSLTISPVRNAQGEIVGASKIARDITAAKESERRIRVLMREVNHRTKNQFAVILSIIRQTADRAANPSEFANEVRDRIMSLSRSHDLLVNGDWKGATIFELIQEQLRPFGREERVVLQGPLLTLNPNAVQNIGMAFHELGTNSAKYGALSGNGEVRVTWRSYEGEAGAQTFELIWDETTSAAVMEIPIARKGFGTVVLQRVVPQALGGSAVSERTQGRVVWTLTAPLKFMVNPAHGDVEPSPLEASEIFASL